VFERSKKHLMQAERMEQEASRKQQRGDRIEAIDTGPPVIGKYYVQTLIYNQTPMKKG
jgi:hypothetical protein